jgi:hypothetical protein
MKNVNTADLVLIVFAVMAVLAIAFCGKIL